MSYDIKPTTPDETAIATYLATWPTDRLQDLATETREGRLNYWGCNCLLGLRYMPEKHKLKPGEPGGKFCGGSHMMKARDEKGAEEAEHAYLMMGWKKGKPTDIFGDEERNFRLLPFIEAELQRRELGVKVDFTVPVVTKVR